MLRIGLTFFSTPAWELSRPASHMESGPTRSEQWKKTYQSSRVLRDEVVVFRGPAARCHHDSIRELAVDARWMAQMASTPIANISIGSISYLHACSEDLPALMAVLFPAVSAQSANDSWPQIPVRLFLFPGRHSLS